MRNSKGLLVREILQGTVVTLSVFLLTVVLCLTVPGFAEAQQSEEQANKGQEESGKMSAQDRETMAMDSTATQWSFQFAYQAMPDYHQDKLDNGQTRPEGNEGFFQLRIVAPFTPKLTGLPFTLLPRLTLRYERNQADEWGFGSTELFVLGIAQDWGTGRWGIGPLINAPADEKIGNDQWGAGFAGAIVNATGNWFYGVLFTQFWRDRDPTLPDSSGAAPLGIALFLNYKLGKGWYVSNGDMVANWDWDSSSFYMPIGIRFGKILVGEKSSWNLYAEYQTSLIYKDWPGSAVENQFRINATYTIPVN